MTSADGGGSSPRGEEAMGEGRHTHEHKHKHHHRRERSRGDPSTKGREEEEHNSKDQSRSRSKSKSRGENKHRDDKGRHEDEEQGGRRSVGRTTSSRNKEGLERKDEKGDEEQGGRRSVGRTTSSRNKEEGLERKESRRGMERKESKKELERKESKRRTKHSRHASEVAVSGGTEVNAVLVEFTRNMELQHRHSEPDLRRLVEDIKIKAKPPEEKKPAKKKLHPAIAMIKSAISTRIASLSKDREEKQKLRETSHRIRRHTVAEAAELFHYEPRESFTPTPHSTPQTTNSSASSSANSSSPPIANEPTNPDLERDNRPSYEERDYRRDSQGWVIEKSYTPELMRIADVDLPPHLTMTSMIGVN